MDRSIHKFSGGGRGMKAMLEIENMPDSCYDCPCCSIDKQCKAKEHKDIPNVFRGRPEWCPLIVEEEGETWEEN